MIIITNILQTLNIALGAVPTMQKQAFTAQIAAKDSWKNHRQ
jgi:hypothetical protein